MIKKQQLENTQEQLTQRISKLEKLPDFLLQYNIDIRYGIFQDERYSFSRNGEMHIGFKK